MVRLHVVGDENLIAGLVVDIRDKESESGAGRLGVQDLAAHGAIALSNEQPVTAGLKMERPGEPHGNPLGVQDQRIENSRVVDVVHFDEIGDVITGHIGDGDADGVFAVVPKFIAGLLAKRSVTLIDPQAIASHVANDQVSPAVLVPVARRDAERVPAVVATRCLRHVLELTTQVSS